MLIEPVVKSADDHPYQVYWQLVAEVAPLSGARELELLGKIAVGATEVNAAKKELVEANLAVAISIAEDYRGFGLDIVNLNEIGNYPLIYAVDTSATGRGYGLSTYIVAYVHRWLETGEKAGRKATTVVPIL